MSDGELRDYYERYYTFDSLLDLYFETIDEKEMLRQQLQQKENIIKEVREYIMTELIDEWTIKNGGNVIGSDLPVDAITPILEILDKENK